MNLKFYTVYYTMKCLLFGKKKLKSGEKERVIYR